VRLSDLLLLTPNIGAFPHISHFLAIKLLYLRFF
jgi:hypothetical protein